MNNTLATFTDVLADEISNSQPMSLPSSVESRCATLTVNNPHLPVPRVIHRPPKGTGQRGQFRSTEEIDPKYRDVFSYPYFNVVQSRVMEDALYSDKSIVVCAPTGSGKTVVFEMAIVQLLMELEDKQYTDDFKIIYMAPVKALCTERLTEWYPKFTKLGLLCIEVTGDTDVDFTQLRPYKIIITTPEKWDMLTRRWRDHRGLVEVIKLFLIDEVHILNDELRGPVLEAVVSRMKTIENSAQSVHRIEQLQKEMQGERVSNKSAPRIRFVAVSATVSNPEDVAEWLGTNDKPAIFYKFGDECRPVKLKRIVEGYPCSEGTSIFKFDIILNYKLWPIIQKYHSGKPTLIFCNTRKSVILTAETLSRELTINFNAEQKAKLTAIASTIKNKKLQALVMSGVGCHHAGLLYEERQNIEFAFRNRDLPILITTTTLAMGVNLPAHLVIVKNTQQYVNGAYQEYSISTVLQMVGRAGRPQFDTEATAVIMTRLIDKPRYQALVGGCEPLQSYLHKRLAENLNSEAALGTVGDVAQCVQWLRSTFLYVRAARDPKKYLGLPQNSQQHLISKKIEELCVKAMNGLASSGLITMDEASCIESTEAGRLMSIFYLDLETMKLIMKIEGTESLDRLLFLICESHELAVMHLRVDERRCLNNLNRNNAAATIRFPMKGKISTRQMKLNCIIQAVLGCLTIPDPSLNQEAMKVMRIADRVCKCLVTYITRPDLISNQPQFYLAVLNSIVLAKCVAAHLWENSPFVSKQLKGIGPTFSTLLASAGKVNFMLLEESHPRDLERIMNKGAPAGNVLRKQVSLLPKYQLTMIPVDEKTVTVQLVLLNHSHLAENMDNLTAGDSHKSYIIVGDSNNHLLLLTAFKDRDLISVFDGTIRHEVRRKHNFEHKIIAHCISSSFVGIDVQSEYLFNNLEQYFGGPSNKTPTNDISSKKTTNRQTCITDTFKERKRKNTDLIDKIQSKEKKKRENAIIENFKHLKESFETASKKINKTNQAELLHRKGDTGALSRDSVPCDLNTDSTNENLETLVIHNNITDIDCDEFIDDEKIDNILNQIENEMCKNKANTTTSSTTSSLNNNNMCSQQQTLNPENYFTPKLKRVSYNNLNTVSISSKIPNRSRKRIMPKSNYNFIDLLERKLSLNDDDEKTDSLNKNNGFSDTIKCQIQKYLSNTKSNNYVPDRNVIMLVDNSEHEHPNKEDKLNEIESEKIDCETPLKSVCNPYPRYEIKEILDGKDLCEKNIMQIIKVKQDENVICMDPNDCYMTTIEEQNKLKEFSTNNFENYQMTKDPCEIKLMNSEKSRSNEKFSYENNGKIIDNKYNEINTKTNIAEDENLEKNIKYECHDLNNYSIESDINSLGFSKDNNENGRTNNTHLHNRSTTSLHDNSAGDMCLFAHGSSNRDVSSIHNPTIAATEMNACSDIVPINKNFFVESQGSPCNDRLKIDDTHRNVHFNLPHCNKVFCNPSTIRYPSVNFCSERQNISSISSMPSDGYKKNSEYVNRYTYSTRKVDVCTKQTPEYCVQVIKKIKVDLDVTAIVSCKPNYFQNNYKRDGEEAPQCNDDNIFFESSKPEHPFQNGSRGTYKMVTTINDDTQNSTLKLKREPPRLSRSQLFTTGNFDRPLDKVNILKENEIDNTPIINKNDKLKILCDTKVHPNETSKISDEVQMPPKTLHDSLKERDSLNVDYENPRSDFRPTESESESEDRPATNNCKIKNILQKYGKVLGKISGSSETSISPNIKRTETSSCSSFDKTRTEHKSTVKSKKPFKISDIHKLHATLPNSILDIKPEEEKNTIFPPFPPFSTKIDFITHTQHEHGDSNSHQYIPCTEICPIEETVTKHDFMDTDLDLQIINLPDDVVDLEPPKDYNIDQSMFDPKTLLQCVVDDDSYEIVPPPPEFCDGITNSPGYNNSITDDNRQFFKEPQLGIYSETDMEYNETIFNDPCATDLTPSREIETWNLSREDSWEFGSSNSTPTKSLTVMHKKSRNNCNFTQNSSVSRHVRLGKYRMSQKNKFKIKK